MKYIKKFENRFTNIFKSSDVNMWDEYLENELENDHRFSKLFQSVHIGNLKRFEYLLPKYLDKINDIYDGQNILIKVIIEDVDLYEQKKMIELLLDNGIDYNFKFEGKTFYDFMIDEKLKKWFDKKYPEIVKELNLNKNANKFNL